MKKCKQCKADVPQDAKKCQHCGSHLGLSTQGKCCGVFIGFFIVLAVMGSFMKKDDTTSIQPTVVETSKQQSKQEAQKELDEIMTLGEQSGLVKSYEFSNKATVVYIGYVWYTQDVAFKKDFLAKIAILKGTLTGYKHFEVRDSISNEKVAEVTALTQSLEVYK